MVEMGRSWIDSSSEVALVREVQTIDVFEASGNVQLQEELASQTVRLAIDLVLFEKL